MGLKMSSGAYVGTKGSIKSVIDFKTRQEAIDGDYLAPPKVTAEIKKFFRRTISSKYKDYKVAKNKLGRYVVASYKPGEVSGSYAVYVKVIGPRGGVISFYKETYAPDGSLIHRKFKKGRDIE
ncbi:MAG: hypothetical protein GX297_02545 [Treponema sp.]|jgi:hypothetical protein|nr:hypothetical protein [Treponema sp.]